MNCDCRAPDLLHDELMAINVGLEVFYQSLVDQGAPVVHVNWRPPAGGDSKMASLLDRLGGRRPVSH